MIRLYNARIMPMLRQNDCSITEGELWTEGERICYVGPETPERPAFEREIDLHGDLIVPGFKDAHTHIPMVFLRSFADGCPCKTGSSSRSFRARRSSIRRRSTPLRGWAYWNCFPAA